MMTTLTRAFLASLMLLLAPVAAAAAVKTLDWDALVPESVPFYNPMNELTPDQAVDFDTVVNYRKAPPGADVPGLFTVTEEESDEAKARLEKEGVNVLELLSKWDAWEAAVEAAGKKLVTALNGTDVRIAGYLLPLEFTDDGNTEFFLVPYVGACIHVPPPPPNQIVYVKTSKPVKVDEAFTPVWISGTMRTEQTSKSLSLVDGSSTVSSGYAIAEAQIQPYSKKE